MLQVVLDHRRERAGDQGQDSHADDDRALCRERDAQGRHARIPGGDGDRREDQRCPGEEQWERGAGGDIGDARRPQKLNGIAPVRSATPRRS